MNIYLSSRYSRMNELRGYAEEIRKINPELVVNSRWLKGDHVLEVGSSLTVDEQNCRFAEEDVEDVTNADMLVMFSCDPKTPGRGGRHVEFGIAVALGIPIAVVGPKENVFHDLPEVEQFDSFKEFEQYILRLG